MATMNVSLPDQMKNWAEKQSDNGRYQNVSDYIRDLIRKDQQHQIATQAFQSAIDEGLQSGTPKAFDKLAFKQRMRQKP
ncbi:MULTISPECIES: type II toxin-antitoxin system ParD family antitoxin [unclassified Bartonella]|uniref:type II toxin-antitoxin system ParD family antitoxin n=1 Tax=unclassified Bartonella TaxID=2645622 RepID=UPI0015FC4367|nr:MULTISPECIES: type II toxin-antitoxin system ParD family antitoxin [unclassified Bartonella]UXN04976.1 type II toxin-antitoxin system ParD family antitoxin [Bartonella sp. HY406]UXN08031.1 type II toxin-antitoxin system ParD family antitoxin [Bartonella sp. HY761]